MDLKDYPTPLTDAEMFLRPPTVNPEYVSYDFARDLERKLAKCREALQTARNGLLAASGLRRTFKLELADVETALEQTK